MSSDVSEISSRKSVPAVGFGEEPALFAHGARERSALVAEELRFEKRLGQRAAVDRHELLVLAKRGEVDRPGDQLLARAALAGQQHGRGDRARSARSSGRSPASALPCPMMFWKEYLLGELLLEVPVFRTRGSRRAIAFSTLTASSSMLNGLLM